MSAILLGCFILGFGVSMVNLISWRLYSERFLAEIEKESQNKGIPIPHELKEGWMLRGGPKKKDYPLYEAISSTRFIEFKRRATRVKWRQGLLMLFTFGSITLRDFFFR